VYPHRPMTATRRPDTISRERAHDLVRSWDGRPGALGSLLGRVSSVDQVGVEERVDSLKKRSIKKASKVWALDLAIRMMDLTTLEGRDTPGKIRALCAKAVHPQPGDPSIPSVAAVCLYPALIPEAKDALRGSSVKVASVATGFPSGQTFRDIKVAEVKAAVAAGADELMRALAGERVGAMGGDHGTERILPSRVTIALENRSSPGRRTTLRERGQRRILPWPSDVFTLVSLAD
jgi:hypothetical protein